jgi:tetratricopeptide (TPR) repeat protein
MSDHATDDEPGDDASADEPSLGDLIDPPFDPILGAIPSTGLEGVAAWRPVKIGCLIAVGFGIAALAFGLWWDNRDTPTRRAERLIAAADEALHARKFERAERGFTLAIAEAESATAYSGRGDARYALGRLDEALEDWLKATALYPGIYVAPNAAWGLGDRGRDREAIAVLTAYMDANGDRLIAMPMRAGMNVWANELDRAEEDANWVIGNASSPPNARVTALCARSIVYARRGDHAAAQRDAETATAVTASDETKLARAYIAGVSGRLDEAVRLCDAVASASADDAGTAHLYKSFAYVAAATQAHAEGDAAGRIERVSQAIDSLRAVRRLGARWLTQVMRTAPELTPIRDDQWFQALLGE